MVVTLKEGRKLGWLSAGVLMAIMLSSSAWALDVSEEIQRQEADAAQILSTLGRDRGAQPSQEIQDRKNAADDVKVQLLPARRTAKKSS